ncbi:hypothetical protein QTO34_010465 [Cnephaeus nilssonii]|uniref:Complex 1 LYR protein domain-containing protein n=1 Tax=Cnephaeus nilssonii TaxID=3371016 RepID=A0AA40HFJ1_CNENI|nr:hypothetical protein QTO34_010465 [Eptesicus nilssonii]
MSRPSRLQRQVLSLYRELLRAGRGKPGAEARVRAEFRQHACLPRSDVLRIEYLYRRGRRQLQLQQRLHCPGRLATVIGSGPTGSEISPRTWSGEATGFPGPPDPTRSWTRPCYCRHPFRTQVSKAPAPT